MRTLPFLSLALLALLPACRKDSDNATDTNPEVDTGETGQVDSGTPAVDADGDGFAEADDCDDTNAEIHPGAVERCDGQDNNCDGLVDDNDPALFGASTWHADADLDGYGGTQFETTACEAPSGYVDNNADCNDWNLNAHPGADEVCDSIDNDCDGTLDEDDATDASTWYLDSDGDGFGSTTTTTTACDAPAGYSLHDGDCDDTDPQYNPGALEADCTDANDYNCDGSVGYADADSDGFPACEDCDDSSASVNDSAVEVCDGQDNNCNGLVDADDSAIADATTWYGDADGDGYGGSQFTAQACSAPQGYVASSDDCNDLDPNSHPGAVEICDSADNDCDTQVDEGVETTFYADGDSDGFGDPSTTTEGCSVPIGYVANGDDCDDTNAQVSPAAYELCDSADNDCDGSVDEDALDRTDWYPDADSDGYGDGSTSQSACSAPANHVTDSADCNDADGSIHPAATELCDSVDNDCDGSTDEADAADAQTWFPDTDYDSYGDSTNPTVACTQPAQHVAVGGDCDDSNGAISPAATEVCDTVDNDCDGALDEDDASDAATWYLDGDLDGYGDATTTACSQPSGYLASGGDCDDTASAVNPGAHESCNGIDDDCNGQIDEGADLLGTSANCSAQSCKAILDDHSGSPADGTYWIDPDSSGAFQIYCDMTTDGGGWTLVGVNGNSTSLTMTPASMGQLAQITRNDPGSNVIHKLSDTVINQIKEATVNAIGIRLIFESNTSIKKFGKADCAWESDSRDPTDEACDYATGAYSGSPSWDGPHTYYWFSGGLPSWSAGSCPSWERMGIYSSLYSNIPESYFHVGSCGQNSWGTLWVK